jgi:hypothetical protein
MNRLSYLLVIIFLAGCGASKEQKFTSSSRGTVVTPTTNKMAECNYISADNMAITGHISTYYDPTTRRIRYDFLNVGLKSLPKEVVAETTYTIQFLRWTEDTDGARALNSIPTRMILIDRSNGSQLLSSTVDKISKSVVDQVITALGTGTTVTATNFHERVLFVLTGVDYKYDGLTVTLVNASGARVASKDILIPPFYADPNIYISKIAPIALQRIHPLYSLRNSGGTEMDYFRMTEDICKEMVSQYSRIPASTETATSENVWFRIITWFKNLF